MSNFELGSRNAELFPTSYFLIRSSALRLRTYPFAQPLSYRCDGRFEWCGLSDLTPEDMSNGKKSGGNGNNPTKLEQAMEFLEQRLSGGPVLVTQLLEEAGKMCPPISEKTLRRAKNLLGIKKDHSSKDNKGGWGWVWFLPEEDCLDNQNPETGGEI